MTIKELVEILSGLDEEKEVKIGYDTLTTEAIQHVTLEEGPGGINYAVIWGWSGHLRRNKKWNTP